MDFSWAELLVIAIVALVCIGPKELPSVLRQLGRMVRTVKRHANQFMAEIQALDQEPGSGSVRWIRGDDGKLYEAYDLPPAAEKKTETVPYTKPQ